MVTLTDDRGRLYLSKELREKHGERYRVVDLPGRIVLIPVDEDPLSAVRTAVGDALDDVSVEALKRDAREAAVRDVEAELGVQDRSGEGDE